MDRDLKEFSAEKNAHRVDITNRLLSSIHASDDEVRFLRMAAQLKDTWSETVASLYAARVLDASLNSHALALVRSADASDRISRRLVIATWALVFATVVLAIATVGFWVAAYS